MEVSKQHLRGERRERARGEEEGRRRGMVQEFSESRDRDGSSENVRMHRNRLRQINLIFGLMSGE